MTKSSKRRSTPPAEQSGARHFAVCVRNDGYPASLELMKLYEVLPDQFADENGLIRVVDESGEDYLYASDYFAGALRG